MRSFECAAGWLLFFLFCSAGKIAGEDFVIGADFSHLAFFESRGVIYKDQGKIQDALDILKQCGLDCVRLRLFTSSAAQAQASPYNYINNLDYTVPLAARVKRAGLKFMLDFHYSDTWADPGHQAKPVAWTNLAFPQLVQQVHDYSSNCITVFNLAGAMPDYVTVGNEITSGMLWPDGKVGGASDTPAQWSKFNQLLNAAIQGINEAAGVNRPKLIIQIDRGGDWAGTQWFFDSLLARQPVPFDIIGESYYPFFHGPMSNLKSCLNQAAQRYGKPVLVAETAFPWTNSYWTTDLYGLPGTTNGQVQFTVALAQIVKGIPGGRGGGICWWGAEYQQAAGVNEAGFNTTSFFDAAGNVLPVAGALGQLNVPLTVNVRLSGTTLTLAWPLSGAGMALMTATSLPPPADWTPMTTSIQSTGLAFTTILAVDASPSRYFRLQMK